jgi:hypothetical protein
MRSRAHSSPCPLNKKPGKESTHARSSTHVLARTGSAGISLSQEFSPPSQSPLGYFFPSRFSKAPPVRYLPARTRWRGCDLLGTIGSPKRRRFSLTGSCSAHAVMRAGGGADPGVGGKKREEPRPQPPPTHRPTAADRTRSPWYEAGGEALRGSPLLSGGLDRLGKMTAQPFSNSFLDRPLAGRHGVPSPLPSPLCCEREREERSGSRRVRARPE